MGTNYDTRSQECVSIQYLIATLLIKTVWAVMCIISLMIVLDTLFNGSKILTEILWTLSGWIKL